MINIRLSAPPCSPKREGNAGYRLESVVGRWPFEPWNFLSR